MPQPQENKDGGSDQDELFFDQLKDSFVFFYAATMAVMDAYKRARALRHPELAQHKEKKADS